MTHVVYVVFGDCPDEKIELANSNHMWIEKSVNNNELAGNYWVKNRDEYSRNKGITIFDDVGNDKVSGFLCLFQTIDEHHYGWDQMVVYGMNNSDMQCIADELVKDKFAILLGNNSIEITHGSNQSLKGRM